MQIPIMAGTTARGGAFAAEYPVNLEPRAYTSGISRGQLVTTRGTVPFATGLGMGRGGIVWNGDHYRVSGSRLIRITSTGTVTDLGDVGNDERPCGFDYSFDRLAIRSANKLFYWNGTALVEVTDTDLGPALDMCWIDGYFATTDGTFLVVSDLLNPASINPLKYGSAEEDPDPVTGVLRFREELYAIGRYTIETFDNVGGINFPFQVVQGATIPFGCVSASAKCLLGGTGFAFVGGGRDEPLGLFVGGRGDAQRISTREVEDLLNAETQPEKIELEYRAFGEETYIYVHLKELTIGVSLQASREANEGAWFILQTDGGQYRPRHAVWFAGGHIVDDTASSAIGKLSGVSSSHFGSPQDWVVTSSLMFSEGEAFHINEVELTGQFPLADCVVFFSMTRDAVVWSGEIARRLSGRRDERVLWRPGLLARSLLGFKWRGNGCVALARADARGEAVQ